MDLSPFRPLPLLRSGWGQTVAASLLPQRADRLPAVHHRVALDDGDRLAVIESRPRGWRAGDRVVVLWHGLMGHHQSSYLVRVARRLFARGHLVLRVNMRGCGPGVGLARGICHAGRSEDVRAVTAWTGAAYPRSPIALAGFSMGGNMVLKMAGEDGARLPGQVDRVVAVSPPVDLALCARTLAGAGVLDQYFVYRLRRFVRRRHAAFPDLGPVELPARLTLTAFDDVYTAPHGGFASAADYYARSSAAPHLAAITVPTLVVSAKDDPVVGAPSFATVAGHPRFQVLTPAHGGHVGFLGRPGLGRSVHWMDELLGRWLGDPRRGPGAEVPAGAAPLR